MRALRLAALVALCPLPALANGFASVGSIDVRKGRTDVSLRGAYGLDDDVSTQDNRIRSRVTVDHAFTEWFASGLYVQGDHSGNDNMELDTVIWDNRIQMASEEEDGFNGGIRLRYSWRDGDKKPDVTRIQFLGDKRFGKWQLRGSQIFFHEVGQDSRKGVGLDTRYQVNYAYRDRHRAGVEGFHNFGRVRDMNGFDAQSHVLGVVFVGPLAENTNYEVGYGAGLSRSAPDHSVKLFVSWNF